jgi:hypothetical protein
MEDSDGENEAPPPGWTKSKSEWEWEQARRKRLERVAEKIKKPGSAKKERAQRAADAVKARNDDASGTAAGPAWTAAGDDAGGGALIASPASDPAAAEADVEELLQTRSSLPRSSLQALCDLKDARIAKDASTAATLRRDLNSVQLELEKLKDEYAAKEAPFNIKIKEQKREIKRLTVELEASHATERELDMRVTKLEESLARAKAETADAKRKLFIRAEGAESNAELKEHLARQNSELDAALKEAAASKVALDEMRAAAAREEHMQTAKKSADDLGRVNSKIADIEEEMAAKMKSLEKTMLALGSNVKKRNCDILRLNMNQNLQQKQIASFKRQLADAEERLGKGSSKSRRELEMLKTAVDERKAATVLAEALMEELSLLRKGFKAALQEQHVVCAALYQESTKTAQDLQHAHMSTAQQHVNVQGLSAEVSSGLKALKTETETIFDELSQASTALSDSCRASEEKVQVMNQRVDALGLKVASERELVYALNQRLADAKRESMAWEKCADQRQTQCEKRSLFSSLSLSVSRSLSLSRALSLSLALCEKSSLSLVLERARSISLYVRAIERRCTRDTRD